MGNGRFREMTNKRKREEVFVQTRVLRRLLNEQG
jgi:hypothetical protein